MAEKDQILIGPPTIRANGKFIRSTFPVEGLSVPELWFDVEEEYGDGLFPLKLKDLFHPQSEGPCHSEGQGQGGHVPSLFQSTHGLARTASQFSQFLLRHLVVLETELSDSVLNGTITHSTPSFHP